MPFYAVAKGRSSGIYHSWAECEAQVKGFPGAEFKKFKSLSSANEFMQSISESGYSADSESSENEFDILVKIKDIKKRLKDFSKVVQPKSGRHHEDYVNVYTVGICWSNGKQGAQAGFGVFWGDNHPLNFSKLVSGRPTDSRGELQAATHAIKTALKHRIPKLAINTSSEALIEAATKLMPEWRRRGWKTLCGKPMMNGAAFKELDRVKNKLQLKWNYVQAYTGNHGIQMAHRLVEAVEDMYQ